MKRKIFLVATVMGLMGIIGGMSSCKKEETSIVNKRFDATVEDRKNFDYDKYIDDLSHETHIDIRTLSQDKDLITLHRGLNNVVNHLKVTNFSREDSILFAEICEQMTVAAQSLDMGTFNAFYYQLLHMLYGDNIPIYMFIGNVQDFAMQNVAYLQQIENNWSQLAAISEIKKREVLSAAFYLISVSDGTKYYYYGCIDDYNYARGRAAINFTINMGFCALSCEMPWVAAACVGWAVWNLNSELRAAEVALSKCG